LRIIFIFVIWLKKIPHLVSLSAVIFSDIFEC